MTYEIRFQMRPDDGYRYAGRYPTKRTAERVRRVLVQNPRVWKAVIVRRTDATTDHPTAPVRATGPVRGTVTATMPQVTNRRETEPRGRKKSRKISPKYLT